MTMTERLLQRIAELEEENAAWLDWLEYLTALPNVRRNAEFTRIRQAVKNHPDVKQPPAKRGRKPQPKAPKRKPGRPTAMPTPEAFSDMAKALELAAGREPTAAEVLTVFQWWWDGAIAIDGQTKAIQVRRQMMKNYADHEASRQRARWLERLKPRQMGRQK